MILVDGGSGGGTPELARPLVDRVVGAVGLGRARQMKVGARLYRGQALVLLLADTQLPAGADSASGL